MMSRASHALTRLVLPAAYLELAGIIHLKSRAQQGPCIPSALLQDPVNHKLAIGFVKFTDSRLARSFSRT